MRSRNQLALLIGILGIIPHGALSQTSPVKFSGAFNLGSELYSSSGIDRRRPSSTYRAVLTPTLTFFDQITLPFEFYLTSDDRGFRQPFNQFGVNPRLWGWVTLHAGYYSARISDLTFGDTRLYGGGVELTPGLFRFSFLYGRSQQAVQTDTTVGVRGVYERTIYALKLGYGRPNEFFVDLNFLHAADDQGSIRNPVTGVSSDSVVSSFDVAPMENAVLSLAYGIPIAGHAVQLTGETAVSALSNDTRSPELTNAPLKLGSLFTPRTSSQIDGASTLSLNVIPIQTLSVRLTGKWVGPGFVSLGYAQMPNDAMEWTVAPSFHLTDGTFSIRPSVGMRYNNLRSNRLSTTKRTIINVSSTIQPSQALGFDLQYSNYGMRSNPKNDTLRIDNISQMVMLSPRYTFPSWDGTSTVVASYTYQNFTDYNVVSSNLSNNQMQSGVLSWSLALPSTLSFSTSLIYTMSTTSVVNTIVRSVNETVGHSFFDNRLTASASIGINSVSVASTDQQVTGRLSASYNTQGWGVFTVSLSTNSYDYGNTTSSKPYSEQQGSFQYTISF
jgi:hypothetical protein